MRLKELVVGFPIRKIQGRIEVLLGLRKRSPWQWLFSGPGGKVESFHIDKNPEEAESRELYEECGLIALPDMLEKHGVFDIFSEGKDRQRLHVYLIYSFFGTPIETDEMKPFWFPIEKIPIRNKVVPGDDRWLMPVLRGEYATGTMWRSADAEKILRLEVFFSQTPEKNMNAHFFQ